jgi:hypothetical protein
MGLASAPRTFQRVMNNVTRELMDQNSKQALNRVIFTYLDDVVIASSTQK